MTKNDDLSRLTDLLIDQHVDSNVIQQALTLICEHFSFLDGAVYETDDILFFYRKETYGKEAVHLPLKITYALSDLADCTNQSIYPIMRETYHPSDTINILDMFHVENMILVVLVHNETKGFLVFTGSKTCIDLDVDKKRMLFVMSGLIARHVIARIDENQVRLMQNTYESIMDSTGIDIYVNDFHTHEILYVNESMAQPYGGKEAFEGKKCWEVLFPAQMGPCSFCPQKHIVDNEGKPSSVYTWDYQRAFDGTWFRVFSSAFYWTDGRLAHVVSSADITDNKQKEELIEYMANYDELTAMPNHRKLLQDGERIIKRIDEYKIMYLLFFDIDGFKAINDTYGHDAGDNFLVELSHFFRQIPMLKDHVYRYGGDEFVAMIYGCDISKMNIDYLSIFIHTRFHKPWILEKGNVMCDVSIGVACYGENANTIQELLYIADMAMYEAKRSGQGNTCYGSKYDEYVEQWGDYDKEI